MKLLNLDEIVPVERIVTISGVQYPIHERSLGELVVEMQKTPEEIQNMNLVEQAQLVLPECPVEVLAGLKLKQLNALIKFATAPDEEVIEDEDGKKN